MNWTQLKYLTAMMLIGDGVLAMLRPERDARTWSRSQGMEGPDAVPLGPSGRDAGHRRRGVRGWVRLGSEQRIGCGANGGGGGCDAGANPQHRLSQQTDPGKIQNRCVTITRKTP